MENSIGEGLKRRSFLKQAAIAGVGLGVPVGVNSRLEAMNSQGTPVQEQGKTGVITLLQTTDVHCQLYPHDELFWEDGRVVFRRAGGYAHLASMIDSIRRMNPNTVLVDTGDMFQGSGLSVKTQGGAMLEVLDAMGYDLYLPGNWEVVYYKDRMQTLLGGLQAPKVCANMYHDLGLGKRGELIFPPYYIWSRLGVKIGFIGYTDPLVPLRQSPTYSRGIIYTKPEENLAYYVKLLKNQEQCDFVVMLAHLGLSQQVALANMEACAGVDYIFGGDTHERVREPIRCTYAVVVEPGAFGSFIGRLDLEISDGRIVRKSYELLEVETAKTKAKKSVTALLDRLSGPHQAELGRVIGYSKVPLYRNFVIENPIDTMILEALDWSTEVDIVLSNGFRFCPPRCTTDQTGLIPITVGYLYDMLPIDATVRTGKVTGGSLLTWLEKELNNVFSDDASKRFGGWLVKFKGLELRFNAFGRVGERVVSVLVGGVPLETERLYSIAACEREGDPDTVLCRMANVQDASNINLTLHAAVESYLNAHSPIDPTPRGWARALDADAQLLTQVTGIPYTFR
jgi:2',3'-cyclic-nucleotide 2'-phosphodiesterase (5'-nucleotidase family)